MFTKGEWKTYKNALGQWAVATDLEPIAQVERHYNAHLIASAPLLYKALKGLCPCQRPVPGGETPYEWAISEKAMVAVRQALSKAEGE